MLVLSWNCAGGLKGKIDEVRLIIDKHKPGIMFINEAEITPTTPLDYLKIDGYSFVSNGDSSRIACYISEAITWKEIKQKHKVDMIQLKLGEFHIVGCYRGFTTKNETQQDHFKKILSNLKMVNFPLLLVGDLNVDPRRDANKWNGRLLQSWAIEEGLSQLVKGFTRSRVVTKQNGQSRLEKSKLDLVYTNRGGDLNVTKESGYNSDHLVIIIDIKTIKCQTYPPEKIVIRDNTRLTENNIISFVQNNPTQIQSIEDLKAYHLSIYEHLAPERVIRIRNDRQIVNPRIEKCKKRRDRFYKKYKKLNDDRYLFRAKQESKNLKKIIRNETKWIVQKKAASSDPKAFWNVVRNIQGKKSSSTNNKHILENGSKITDASDIANRFACFFSEKLQKLTKDHPRVKNVKITMDQIKERRIVKKFTKEEVLKASKLMKSKLSTGSDGVPTRIVKYACEPILDTYTYLLNEVLESGMPAHWKLARVIAIQKKKDDPEISNHRPISNLCGLEKLFEKCLLARLEELGMDNLVGKHQHAYRKFHSTSTCLMEINNKICSDIDSKMKSVMYTVDLSAAFDLLRADIFLERFEAVLPDYLLWSLGDFLTERYFYVQRDKMSSSPKKLELGCVQGSVLGPILFNMYLNDLPSAVNADLTVTYADDTYVLITGKEWKECENKITRSIANHVEYLKNRGMICNIEKTELIIFNGPDNHTIKIEGKDICSAKSIKALGLTIDSKMKWNLHVDKQVSRVTKILNGIRIVKRKFEPSQLKKIVTSQVFSILYYCDTVWLNPSIGHENLNKLRRIHYAALRIVLGDWRRTMSKTYLNSTTQRLPPEAWGRFSASSFIIKLCRSHEPTQLWETFQKHLYHNARHPNPTVNNLSKKKIGRKIIGNWIGGELSKLKLKWFDEPNLSDTVIRTTLKKLYYSEVFV